MKRNSALIYAFILLAGILVLSGCSKKEKKEVVSEQVVPIVQPEPKSATNNEDINQQEENKLVDCRLGKALLPEQQLWCEGEKALSGGQYHYNVDKSIKVDFIHGYEQGALDAQKAIDPKVPEKSEGLSQAANSAGYSKGYHAVVNALGYKVYICHADKAKKYTELQGQWCNAQKLYRTSGLGSDTNVILENRFISGYFSGQTIALMLPSSMHSIMKRGGSASASAVEMHAINKLSAHASLADKAFHQGFEEGFSAMLTKVKQSVDQVMKQLQVPEKTDHHE